MLLLLLLFQLLPGASCRKPALHMQ
jgi:hypothetical protein